MRPTLDAVEPISFADLDKGLLVPRADFELWLEKHDWTYHQISRNEFPKITFANYYTERFKPQTRIKTLGEFQLRCINNDPGLWVPYFLREPEDPDHLDSYALWPYQLESIRHICPTIHKCGAEVGKTRELTAWSLWKAFTVPGGSGLVGAPQLTHLEEIIDAKLDQLEWNEDLKPSLIRHKKVPHHSMKWASGFKEDYRPAGHDGEAFRGVHVRTYGIIDEAAKLYNKKQWSEFFRALKPGCVPKFYSVPDGRRDTEFYRLGKLAEGADKAEASEATKAASKYVQSLKYKLIVWPKTIMPPPYWTPERKTKYIDEFGGEDSPGYQHNIMAQDGDPENPVFPWSQFQYVVKEVPEYRCLKILVDDKNNEVIVRGYKYAISGYNGGPVPEMITLIDTTFTLKDREKGKGFFDYDLVADSEGNIKMTESEFRNLIKGFFVKVPGLNRMGGDFGYSQDPTELLVKHIVGKEKIRIARLHMKHVTYDIQDQAFDALDDIYCLRDTISGGTDLGNAGSAVMHDLCGLPQYRHKDYENRLKGFQFEGTTENRDEEGTPMVDAKNDKPVKITMKEFATDHLTRGIQRHTEVFPPDPDMITFYTGHTCTAGKHRIYDKKNDHIIDADRAEELADKLGVEMDEPFACGSKLR
jgi:hypothetical protein